MANVNMPLPWLYNSCLSMANCTSKFWTPPCFTVSIVL